MVIDQVYDQAAGRPDPEDPTRCVLVFPRAGCYCAFDGALGHGVLDSFAGSRRATLLVNWWAHQPQVGAAGGGGRPRPARALRARPAPATA